MRYFPVFPKSLDEMQFLSFQELVARWDQLTDLDEKGYIITSEGHEPLVLCPASWYHFWYSSEIDEVLYALCVQSAKDDEATVQRRLDLAHSLVGDICLDEVPKTLERLESVLPGHPLEQQWREIMEEIRLRFEKLERSYNLRPGVLRVKAGQDYQVYLLCKDQKTRFLDMKPFLGRNGYGAKLADLDFFHSRICVMHETLAWDTFGDGSEYTCIDFDPAFLYINATVLSEEEAKKIWE